MSLPYINNKIINFLPTVIFKTCHMMSSVLLKIYLPGQIPIHENRGQWKRGLMVKLNLSKPCNSILKSQNRTC